MLLPKRLIPSSRVNLINVSSPVSRDDLPIYDSVAKRIAESYPHTERFEVTHVEQDPYYLAASEDERLRVFRSAIRNANWLSPVYGGTGCGDVIRNLTDEDLAIIKSNRPIVNGFSDTCYLINYLHLKIGLLTYHYSNTTGLFDADNSDTFIELLKGEVKSLSYREPDYRWLTEAPPCPIQGSAVGGNSEALRDVLDFMHLDQIDWSPFILFLEDINVDAENFHKIVISLDQHDVFRKVRAVVIGRIDAFNPEDDYVIGADATSDVQPAAHDANVTAAKPHPDAGHYFRYLLSHVIKERQLNNDPLYILHVSNLGHNVSHNPMIVPIGGDTSINSEGRIDFIGPFVE